MNGTPNATRTDLAGSGATRAAWLSAARDRGFAADDPPRGFDPAEVLAAGLRHHHLANTAYPIAHRQHDLALQAARGAARLPARRRLRPGPPDGPVRPRPVLRAALRLLRVLRGAVPRRGDRGGVPPRAARRARAPPRAAGIGSRRLVGLDIGGGTPALVEPAAHRRDRRARDLALPARAVVRHQHRDDPEGRRRAPRADRRPARRGHRAHQHGAADGEPGPARRSTAATSTRSGTTRARWSAIRRAGFASAQHRPDVRPRAPDRGRPRVRRAPRRGPRPRVHHAVPHALQGHAPRGRGGRRGARARRAHGRGGPRRARGRGLPLAARAATASRACPATSRPASTSRPGCCGARRTSGSGSAPRRSPTPSWPTTWAPPRKRLDEYLEAVAGGRLPIQDLYHLPASEGMAKMTSVSFYFGQIDLAAFRRRFGVELAERFPAEVALRAAARPHGPRRARAAPHRGRGPPVQRRGGAVLLRPRQGAPAHAGTGVRAGRAPWPRVRQHPALAGPCNLALPALHRAARAGAAAGRQPRPLPARRASSASARRSPRGACARCR